MAIEVETFDEVMDKLVIALNVAAKADHLAKGFTSVPHDPVHWKKRGKYAAIDFGGSGAFMVEIATGELYNIKSKYGVPDKNKKQKADIGNIYTVDPKWLHNRRRNYLR